MLRNFILEFCLIFCGKILYFVTAAQNFKFNVTAKSSGVVGRYSEVFAPNFKAALVKIYRILYDLMKGFDGVDVCKPPYVGVSDTVFVFAGRRIFGACGSGCAKLGRRAQYRLMHRNRLHIELYRRFWAVFSKPLQ